MTKLFDYLDYIVSTCIDKITFSGDMFNYINRWLVLAQEAEHYETCNTRPLLKPTARLLLRHEMEFLSQEEYETNWKLYGPTNWLHYLCQHSEIQKGVVLDKDKYVYGVSTLYCDEEHEAMIYCRGMTPYSFWINDQLVYSSNYDFYIKEHNFVFKLKKGINIILVEKPYFMRNKDIGIDPDDFIISVKPYEFCKDKKENRFFDLSLFQKMRRMYTLVLNRTFFKTDEEVEVLVLPRYFEEGQKEEVVTIRAYDEYGQIQGSVTTNTVTKTVLPITPGYQGILKLVVDVEDHDNITINNYIVFGDLVELAHQAIEKAKERTDYNEDIAYSINRLVEMPDFKVGNLHDFKDMMNTHLYYMIYKAVYEYLQYLQKPEQATICKPFDVFTSSAPIFRKLKIDDNYLSYYIVLPKDYDASKKYPLIYTLEYGFGMSQYSYLKEFQINQDFEDAIVVETSGRGELNKDYISEVGLLAMIDEIVRDYNINRDKIYAFGSCTGSMRAYGLAIRNPGLFAGVFSLDGTIRLNLENPDYEPLRNLETLSVNHMFCVQDCAYNGSTVSGTFRHVKNAVLRAAKEYQHDDMIDALNSKILIREAVTHTRNRYPKEIHFTVNEPIYNRCHYIYIDKMMDLTKKAVIDAKIMAPNHVVITGINTEVVSLLLNKEAMELQQDIILTVDGNEYPVTLDAYTKVTLAWREDGMLITQRKLTQVEFFDLLDAVVIDDLLLGIKGLYLDQCRIIYAEHFMKEKDSLMKRFIRLLSLPLAERTKNYRYDKFVEGDITEDELSQSNFVYLSRMDVHTKIQELLYQEAGLTMNQEALTYRGVTYDGESYIIVKVPNPFNQEKFALLIAYNSDRMKMELINLYSTFDNNGLFYGDSIVYNNDQFYSFRNQ